LLQDVYADALPWGPDTPLDTTTRAQQEEYVFCKFALSEVNKLDIQTNRDLQICLGEVAEWLTKLFQDTCPAKGFQKTLYHTAHNVQNKVLRQQQGLCWACGDPGHLKGNCPHKSRRLSSYR
jgi:hypothetical protein